MDYKNLTKDFYNFYGDNFGKSKKGNYNNFIKDFMLEDLDYFIKNLGGKIILDLGSGPGRDSEFFKEIGFNPICIDISHDMIKACKAKGLIGAVMDFENMGIAKNSIDGIWAYASLLHIPKANISNLFLNLNKLLKKEGLFYFGMKEGDYEGFIPNQLVPDYCKFMALYNDNELRYLAEKNFDIIKFSRARVDEFSVYLNYLCKKKLA